MAMRIGWLALVLAVGSGTVLKGEVVRVEVETGKVLGKISPWVYGINRAREGAYGRATLERVGGNRWTAYNWTNNASNAGSDWRFQNDGFLSKSEEPGAAVSPALGRVKGEEEAVLLTVPTAGWVAADRKGDGDVRKGGSDYLEKRFVRSVAKRAGEEKVVSQQEFVRWVKEQYPGLEGRVFFCLDNEVDLWAHTHAEVHPEKPTYAEIVEKTVAYAGAIKEVVPGAVVLAPVHYGWQGMVNLQGAPDGAGRNFTEFYLKEMAAAEKKGGRRLLDVYDVHWYPEVRAGPKGERITEQGVDDASRRARVEAVRSLWDATYVENSWITRDAVKGPIELLPRLKKKIEAYYPGTKLAITEYSFGAGGDISGGAAQAEALGVFGREGVWAACEWPLRREEPFVAAAIRMYRDFDGKGGAFGDVAVEARVSEPVGVGAYGSVDSKVKGRTVVVVVNREGEAKEVEVRVAGSKAAGAWQVAGTRADVVEVKVEGRGEGVWRVGAPGWSVTTVEVRE